MEQIAFRLVSEEDLEDVVKDLLLDHVLDRHGFFGLYYGFEEFDDFNIGLDRFVAMAVDNFEQDLIVHEEEAELVGVYVVDDQLVKELQNKNAALVNLLPISCRNLGVNCVPRVLTLQLLVFHLSVCCCCYCCISLLCYKLLFPFCLLNVLQVVVLCQELHELRDDLVQDDLLEILLHFRSFLACEVLEELANADFDPLLARVHHVLSQMAQEDIVVLLLVVGAQELANGRMVHIVQKDEQVVKDLDRVRFEDVNLSHAWVLRMQWVLEILLDCGATRVDNAVLVVGFGDIVKIS